MGSCLPWWATIEWRSRKRVMLLLCAFEFLPCIALLTLYGIADPDTYRTQLWQEGANHGWNSDPIELLYAAANYKPISAPVPWNQYTTDFGLVCSVLTTFVLLVKIVMYLTHVFFPILSAIVHGVLFILWSYSLSRVAAPDYSDPTAPARVPYYLSRGCGPPVNPSLYNYCRQAQGAAAATSIEIVLIFVYIVFSVMSSFPSAQQKDEQREKEREEQEWRDIENYKTTDFEQELDQMHLPPGTPSFPAYPMSPAKASFGVYQTEAPMEMPPPPAAMPRDSRLSMGSNSSGGQGQMARPNKDLPLRHHITSDVYQ